MTPRLPEILAVQEVARMLGITEYAVRQADRVGQPHRRSVAA